MPNTRKLPLTEYLPVADRVYFGLDCRNCPRHVRMGVRRAVRLAADSPTTERWLERLRCTKCGGRGASIIVCADTRGQTQKEQEGPLPVTLEE